MPAIIVVPVAPGWPVGTTLSTGVVWALTLGKAANSIGATIKRTSAKAITDLVLNILDFIFLFSFHIIIKKEKLGDFMVRML
jgi:hypothetical protein